MNPGVVSVDIGGSVVKAGFVTEAESKVVQGRVEVATGTNNADESIAAVLRAVRSVESFAGDHDVEIVGYGFTPAGPTDPTRSVFTKPQLGWVDFPLRAHLEKELDSSNIVIQNDANAAAFGCWWHAGRHDESLLLVTVSTGVGGGFVLPGGEVFDGSTANGFEIGHIPYGDFECEYSHGVGCIEGSASGSGIRKRFGIDPKNATREIRETVAKDLGTALVGVLATCDPHSIAFMGSVSYGFQETDTAAGFGEDERFISLIKKRIRDVSVNSRDIDVWLSPFGDDTGILGGAALALHNWKH